MTFTGPWANKPTSNWTRFLTHDSPPSTITSNLHMEIFNNPLHPCRRAQPSPSLNITLPVLFQECRRGDIGERGLGDGLHMMQSWQEGARWRIPGGNDHCIAASPHRLNPWNVQEEGRTQNTPLLSFTIMWMPKLVVYTSIVCFIVECSRCDFYYSTCPFKSVAFSLTRSDCVLSQLQQINLKSR